MGQPLAGFDAGIQGAKLAHLLIHRRADCLLVIVNHDWQRKPCRSSVARALNPNFATCPSFDFTGGPESLVIAEVV